MALKERKLESFGERTIDERIRDLVRSEIKSNRDVGGTRTKQILLRRTKFETHSEDTKGIKIFNGVPTEVVGDTSVFLPTANAEPASPFNGAQWTNPTNAQAVDGAYATAVQGAAQRYNIWKSFTGLQAAIPSGAIITGITVRCFAKVDTLAQIAEPKLLIQLSKDGSTVVGLNRLSQALLTTDAFVSAGDAKDLWGTTWVRADFVANFGVMITGSATSTPSTTYSIDYIQVTVHYVQTFNDSEGEDITDSFFEIWNRLGNVLIYLKQKVRDLVIDKANLILKGTLTAEPQEEVFSNTAAQSPTETAEPTGAFAGAMWTTPSNAFSSNDAYATAVTTERFTIWKNFGLKSLIPAGATIKGIEVKVEGKVSSGVGGVTVDMVKDGLTPTGTNKSNLTGFGTTDSVITLGDSTDLWGATWNAEEFVENFGVMIRQSPVSAVTVSVDHVTVKVYYTTTGNNSIKGNILPSVHRTYDLGSSSLGFRRIYAGDFSFGYPVMKLLKQGTFLGSFDIIGLASNTEKTYRLFISYHNTIGRDCSLQFNDDTAANYHVAIHEFGEIADVDVHTGVSEANAAQGDITLSRGLKRVAIEITIIAGNTLRPMVISHSAEENDDDDLNFVLRTVMGNWDTANAITKINVLMGGSVTTGEYQLYALNQ